MHSNELEKLVAPELDSLGFECVKLEVVGSAASPVVRIYIDKPDGVTIKDCQMVSRSVSLLLERDDPFPGKYLLEVSSPGSNRPLVSEDHFRRFTGSRAQVKARVEPVNDGEDTAKITYTGIIRSCINGVLTLDTADGAVEVDLSRLISAQLVDQEYKIDKKQKKEKRSRREKRKGDSS